MIVNETLIFLPVKLLLVSLAQDIRSSMSVVLLLMVLRMLMALSASFSSRGALIELAA